MMRLMYMYIMYAQMFLFLLLWRNSDAQSNAHLWFLNNINYPSQDYKLIKNTGSGTIDEMVGYSMPSQCAMRCFMSGDCQSYNFNPALESCEIMKGNDKTIDFTLIYEEGFRYYRRETLALSPNGLGPCASNPCDSDKFCFDIETAGGDPDYFCLCNEGWQGDTCSEQLESLAFTNWEEWGACSKSCDDGIRLRHRSCMRGADLLPAALCQGSPDEGDYCNQGPCPAWDPWSAWEMCTTMTTCGRGTKSRNRNCLPGGTPNVDSACTGLVAENAICEMPDCKTPVSLSGGSAEGEGQVVVNTAEGSGAVCADGWDLNDATVVCHEMGHRSGAAEATTLPAEAAPTQGYMLSGLDCAGSEGALVTCPHDGWQEDVTCTSGNAAAVKCIVDGEWSTWGLWGACSVTCAVGIQERDRQCDHPASGNGGADCVGEPVDQKECVEIDCPVNGEWAEWKDWAVCPVSCGGGSHSRERDCVAPQNNGAWCVGDNDQTEACNTQDCPVNGYWEDWSNWIPCSEPCGTGTQNRTRQCHPPEHGGDPCTGPKSESKQCNTQPCSIEGYWEEWSDWGTCSQTCGGGTSLRDRQCVEPLFGGKQCAGVNEEQKDCNSHECPVDGVWEVWSDWSECSVTCENGTQTRARECDGPYHNGQECTGAPTEIKECFPRMCPIDGYWGEWSDWGDCSVTCADGSHTRSRACVGPLHGGDECSGSTEDTGECHLTPCPVSSVWGAWLEWTECSLSCGGGLRHRMRECETELCVGTEDAWDECNAHLCPVDGNWLAWTDWSTCSASCGGGQTARRRVCDGPYYGGNNCTGSERGEMSCSIHKCPVDGKWMTWSGWDDCTVPCGGGSKGRRRECVGPFYGGATCDGINQDSLDCNMDPCPVNGEWTHWTPWKDCDATCGGGTQIRDRTCYGMAHGGEVCDGSGTESQPCNPSPCPINGVWNPWSSWSGCSVSCGAGTWHRGRTCDGPHHGGEDCDGDRTDTNTCFPVECPRDGEWSMWSVWSDCSEDCGGGNSTRGRLCTEPMYDGKPCEGVDTETVECNTDHCPVDCIWDEWNTWTECDLTCGGGIVHRDRENTPAMYGGQDCTGVADDEDACNTHECPIDGYYSEWATWSACPVTCGGGISVRIRSCIPPLYGGMECKGVNNETRQCGEDPCELPGLWGDWGAWTDCSVTCGGGTRTRTRPCDQTTGLHTLPCEGDDSEMDSACNDMLPCSPAPIACAYAVETGIVNSDWIEVDPDGNNPFWAWCDVATGESTVHHKYEEEIEVRGYEGPGEYGLELEYVNPDGSSISIQQATSLVSASETCKQMLVWRCRSAVFNAPFGTIEYRLTYPENVYGEPMSYWGGARMVDPITNPNSVMCACGETGTCGAPDRVTPGLKCNCDLNDEAWREDSGYIDYKGDLPLTAVRAGDTGSLDFARADEAGYVAVGPLICTGKSHPDSHDYNGWLPHYG